MTESTSIERIVMRRVRLIRLLALIVSTATFAVLTCIAALWGIGREVWVAHIFQNMPQSGNPGEVLTFYWAAFLHTRFIVQVLTILTFTSLVFLAREIARTLADYLKS